MLPIINEGEAQGNYKCILKAQMAKRLLECNNQLRLPVFELMKPYYQSADTKITAVLQQKPASSADIFPRMWFEVD